MKPFPIKLVAIVVLVLLATLMIVVTDGRSYKQDATLQRYSATQPGAVYHYVGIDVADYRRRVLDKDMPWKTVSLTYMYGHHIRDRPATARL